MTERVISHEDFLRAEGLLTLARDHNAALKAITKALAEVVREVPDDYGYYGHVDDAVIEGYRAETLVHKLGVNVDPAPEEESA